MPSRLCHLRHSHHLGVMSRPKPRQDLSIGRKIIKIELQIIPTAALAGISVGDPPEEVRLHLIRA
ncbi:hypothetical protein HID58_053398 [Brassica napus]|uniref:Uncharacterized protein n=1 Tax=Brassica napus TaxID=3708 RepID=A0ABQ8AEL5_BRANA|nr:hypothetical protein HID58_053398 [Brassica napus]